MDTTPRHTPFLFTFDHTYIFQLHYGFNRHLKNLSLITHEINVLSDTLSSALCPFDGNRCAQTLCAVTGFMSSVYEYIHLLRSAVMTSYRDRDQHLPWPERLFRRPGYVARYATAVRGSMCCSLLSRQRSSATCGTLYNNLIMSGFCQMR